MFIVFQGHIATITVAVLLTIIILFLKFFKEGEEDRQGMIETQHKPVMSAGKTSTQSIPNFEQEVKKKFTLFGLEKHIIGYLITASFTVICTVVAFGFNTKSTLLNHTEKLDVLDKKMTIHDFRFNDMGADVASMKIALKDIRDNQDQTHQDIKQTQEQIEKIYEILLTNSRATKVQ